MPDNCEVKKKEGPKRRWYQKYLPFIARSPEMQVEWLVNECQRKNLAREELTPYIRLLFSDENIASEDELQRLLADISPEMQKEFVDIADICKQAKRGKVSPETFRQLMKIHRPTQTHTHMQCGSDKLALEKCCAMFIEEIARHNPSFS